MPPESDQKIKKLEHFKAPTLFRNNYSQSLYVLTLVLLPILDVFVRIQVIHTVLAVAVAIHAIPEFHVPVLHIRLPADRAAVHYVDLGYFLLEFLFAVIGFSASRNPKKDVDAEEQNKVQRGAQYGYKARQRIEGKV